MRRGSLKSCHTTLIKKCVHPDILLMLSPTEAISCAGASDIGIFMGTEVIV